MWTKAVETAKSSRERHPPVRCWRQRYCWLAVLLMSTHQPHPPYIAVPQEIIATVKWAAGGQLDGVSDDDIVVSLATERGRQLVTQVVAVARAYKEVKARYR